jgi:hypothetical protein
VISVRGREVCPCVRADGETLFARASCGACGGEGGVGAERPTKEEEAELWRGGWVAAGPCSKVAGRWVPDTATWHHPLWGTGRWRTALALARDESRPRWDLLVSWRKVER